MAIETSPAHQQPELTPLLSRPTNAGIVSTASLVLTWTTLTFAHADGLVHTDDVAASPIAIANGRLWLLLTSGLVAQRPIVLSLVCFSALACLAVAVCGSRVLWLDAVIGHVLSTAIAYALLATVRAFHRSAYGPLLHAPDYGVSAIAAAWLGSVATTAWEHRSTSARGRLSVALSCVAVALFAWMVQRHAQKHLTFLDSEHGFAFLLGIFIVRSPWNPFSAHVRALHRKPRIVDTEGAPV